MSFLSKQIRRFLREEKGTIVVDAVMVMPMFIWAYAALFAYWDAYRSINTVQKAAFTISDLVSRSQAPVNNDYIDGMGETMNYMLDADQAGDIRVTSYRWSEANDRFEIIFSRGSEGAMPALTTADLSALSGRLPEMSDGESAVLLETRVPYTPPMAFGLQPTVIEQFVVTRPRFLPKLCHVLYVAECDAT